MAPWPSAPDTEPLPAARSHVAHNQPSVVIQTSFLGDVILTTPLLAALAERGPVDVVTTPTGAPLLARHPAVREVIVYDKRGGARGVSGLWHTAQLLKARFGLDTPTREPPPRSSRTSGGNGAPRLESPPPIAYLAQGSVRSGMLALLAGFAERVGFSTAAGRALYTRTVPYRGDRHHAERLWRLGAPSPDVEPPAGSILPRLFPDDSDVRAVDALLARAGYDGAPLVALAPGSAWGAKRWPAYPALASVLARIARVVVVGGVEDRGLAAEIGSAVAGTPGTVIDATGALTVLGAAELIRRCAVIVTNDSAPQHLASAMRTPTVTIFGPTVPEFGFGPLAPRHTTMGVVGLECRPCDKHGPQQCPLGHWRCMRDLTVSQVEDAVRRLTAPAAD
jgi:heptosyltransferase-2